MLVNGSVASTWTPGISGASCGEDAAGIMYILDALGGFSFSLLD